MTEEQIKVYFEDGPLSDRTMTLTRETRFLVVPAGRNLLTYRDTGRVHSGVAVWSAAPERQNNAHHAPPFTRI